MRLVRSNVAAPAWWRARRSARHSRRWQDAAWYPRSYAAMARRPITVKVAATPRTNPATKSDIATDHGRRGIGAHDRSVMCRPGDDESVMTGCATRRTLRL